MYSSVPRIPQRIPGRGGSIGCDRLMAIEMTSFRIKPDEFKKILSVLNSLVEKSEASLASLISSSGQEIAFSGGNGGIDRTALAALAASNLAATLSIADLIEENGFERIYHRGKKNSVLMIPIDGQFFLLIVFSNTVKSLHSFRAVKSSMVLLRELMGEIGNA
jgi:predicted regulator of Ras-like GTPase activity (Roadblock/LC7/MglB family)